METISKQSSPSRTPSSASGTTRERSPAREQEILNDLRQQIVRGDLAPASRMPTRRQLSFAYAASTRTVQSALDSLAADGFVEAHGPKGTFVSQRPPHLCTYALVFTHAPDRNQFWTALHSDALRRRREQTQQIDVWHNIDGHADNEDYRRLIDQVKRHRVAGLIFVGDGRPLSHTPLMNEPNVPRVAISTKEKYPNVSTVSPDNCSFRRRALDHLAGQGCRRVAFLLPVWDRADALPLWYADAAARGLDARPYWTQQIPPDCAASATNIAHMLFNPLQSERPDGFVVADDNLVEAATIGLLNAGVAVGRDVKMVVHCNFPWPTQSIIPVRRLGYSAGALMGACFSELEKQRANGGTVATEFIPAMFEDELEIPS